MYYKKMKELNLATTFWLNIAISLLIISMGIPIFNKSNPLIEEILLIILVCVNYKFHYIKNMPTYEMRSMIERSCKSKAEKERAYQRQEVLLCINHSCMSDYTKRQCVINAIIITVMLICFVF